MAVLPLMTITSPVKDALDSTHLNAAKAVSAKCMIWLLEGAIEQVKNTEGSSLKHCKLLNITCNTTAQTRLQYLCARLHAYGLEVMVG